LPKVKIRLVPARDEAAAAGGSDTAWATAPLWGLLARSEEVGALRATRESACFGEARKTRFVSALSRLEAAKNSRVTLGTNGERAGAVLWWKSHAVDTQVPDRLRRPGG
jgi:hypothetical protein